MSMRERGSEAKLHQIEELHRQLDRKVQELRELWRKIAAEEAAKSKEKNQCASAR